jgi:hypothetical protein
MNSSVTRIELFAFWYWIEYASTPESTAISKPADLSARAFFSSTDLHQMNPGEPSLSLMMSGWSMLNTTILAARRVAPPDLIVPAAASAPRMNDTGPEL